MFRARSNDLESLLQRLYDRNVPVELRSVWDLGWNVTVDDVLEPQVDTVRDATAWIMETLQEYPDFQGVPSDSLTETRPIFDIAALLQALYDSEFDVWVRSVPGKGWNVGVRDLRQETQTRTLQEVAAWLHATVVTDAPKSGYALVFGGGPRGANTMGSASSTLISVGGGP